MNDEAFLAMRARLTVLLPRLNERDRRAAMAAEAISWGRGGISAVHRATGASRTTIRRGMAELADDEPATPSRRVRAPGAGRKKTEVADPTLLDTLNSLVEPRTQGSPESPLRWTTKSTRNLARELTEMGHRISHSVVAKILGSLGYTLQRTRKTPDGQQPSDRDAQFRYINKLAEQFLTGGDPVLSIDTNKKELVGRYAQAGKERQPKDEPAKVSTYDFPEGLDKDDSAWTYVSIDHDASVFAVTTIEQWWHTMGKNKYPNTRRILITADCGGSTDTAPGRGNSNSPGSLQQPDSTSSSATTHPAPANGTRSNIDSSPGSPTTGADNHSKYITPSSIISPTPRPRPAWPHTANSIPIPTPLKSNMPTSRGNQYPSPGTNFTVTGITLSDHLTSIPAK
jgi:transposase